MQQYERTTNEAWIAGAFVEDILWCMRMNVSYFHCELVAMAQNYVCVNSCKDIRDLLRNIIWLLIRSLISNKSW